MVSMLTLSCGGMFQARSGRSSTVKLIYFDLQIYLLKSLARHSSKSYELPAGTLQSIKLDNSGAAEPGFDEIQAKMLCNDLMYFLFFSTRLVRDWFDRIRDFLILSSVGMIGFISSRYKDPRNRKSLNRSLADIFFKPLKNQMNLTRLENSKAQEEIRFFQA